jgi:hypothetical protein
MKIRTTKASYTVFRTTPDFIAVTDDNKDMSITNDAKAVTRDLTEDFGTERRFFYRDTQGEWTELAHNAGRFTGFRPVGEGWCQTFGLVPPSNKHTIIHPNGRVETKDAPLSLEEMHGLVAGDIQRLPMADGRFMLVNEYGKSFKLPINQKATALIKGIIPPGNSIFGTAIIVPSHFLEPSPEQPPNPLTSTRNPRNTTKTIMNNINNILIQKGFSSNKATNGSNTQLIIVEMAKHRFYYTPHYTSQNAENVTFCPATGEYIITFPTATTWSTALHGTFLTGKFPNEDKLRRTCEELKSLGFIEVDHVTNLTAKYVIPTKDS